MDEKPTVQMDASADEWQDDESKTPSTIPIDDMYREPGWPQPVPVEEPTPRPFSQQPRPQPPQTGPAGKTMIMREPVSIPLLAWLAVVGGPGASRGQVYTLQKETIIGRETGQIILAGDSYVSGQHAKVRLESSEEDEEKQVFVLYDLASANGTFAGDREEYQDSQIYRHELTDGDFVLLGETSMVFKQVRLESDD